MREQDNNEGFCGLGLWGEGAGKRDYSDISKVRMVSDEYEIYQDDDLVSYMMSSHWGVHLKLI